MSDPEVRVLLRVRTALARATTATAGDVAIFGRGSRKEAKEIHMI